MPLSEFHGGNNKTVNSAHDHLHHVSEQVC